jgi:hypothetical protein
MIASLAPTLGAGHDLRGHAVAELRYPADSVLVVAGLPGAGKTTLLRRMFATTGAECTPLLTADGVQVLDSEQARNWWQRCLSWMPYLWWRPLMHATHYLRIVLALRAEGVPMVVHDCATRSWSRRLIIDSAHRSHRTVHLLLLDVSPRIARAAQIARGRQVLPASFAAHCRGWHHLVRAAEDPTHAIHRRTASIVLIDRAVAARLRAIRFTAL